MNGEFIGGLYGIRLGNLFFGESMFMGYKCEQVCIHKLRDQIQRKSKGDRQVYTAFGKPGAKMIDRKKFAALLSRICSLFIYSSCTTNNSNQLQSYYSFSSKLSMHSSSHFSRFHHIYNRAL